MNKYIILMFALMLIWTNVFAQESSSESSLGPPKDLGLSIHFGFNKSDVSSLNEHLTEYGYNDVDDINFSAGLSYSILETEQFSYEVVSHFSASQKLLMESAGMDGSSKINYYGFSLLFRPGGNLYARKDQRLQLLLGIGCAWNYLSSGREQSFNDFFSSGYVSNGDIYKMSYIMQPALRYQYWFTKGLPVGILLGYTIPILSEEWSNASTPIFTRGYTIHDGPTSSQSGPFVSIQIPLILYSQNK